MACETIIGYDADANTNIEPLRVVFYDTVSMTTFGPVMTSLKESLYFRKFLYLKTGESDPRAVTVNELMKWWGKFCTENQ